MQICVWNTSKILESGFSMLEVLISISISAIVLGAAIPEMSKLMSSYDKLNAKSAFVKDLKRAQAESITQGCRGIVEIAADGRSYSFGCDYLPYDDSEEPAHDVQSFARELPAHMTISNDTPIIFNSRGQSIDTNYIIANVTVNMSTYISGGYEQFASGTLLGTGVFSFD